MPEIEARVNGGTVTKHQLPENPTFKVIVHQPGTRVDVPEFLEINVHTTIHTMRTLKQNQWSHISTGPVFKHFFNLAFPPDEEENIFPPEKIEDMQKCGFDVLHICGMIIALVEEAFAVLDGKKKEFKVFVREPETHLHPKTQRHIVTMLKAVETMVKTGKLDTTVKIVVEENESTTTTEEE